ncbi:hypothetical protein NC653_041067 [Populus alba x Populus x berolinensis]|uniref:Uncharacterized protein n=1 Tax=Populus alba x Populus x berolinensis TaxID=444605 RepID=A0AAD6L7I9_9ROSI|nr:hypothetical protein NC653_041067 [Populus alba x Populus x berolinensis]
MYQLQRGTAQTPFFVPSSPLSLSYINKGRKEQVSSPFLFYLRKKKSENECTIHGFCLLSREQMIKTDNKSMKVECLDQEKLNLDFGVA